MFPNKITRHKLGCFGHNKIGILQNLYLVFFPKYSCHKIPSTSPANARYNLNSLIDDWSNIIINNFD